MSTRILATGGAGYIGSNVVTELLAAGCEVVVLDDFSNSRPEVIEHIASLGHGRPGLVIGDVGDDAILDTVFTRYRIDAVIHLAGLKAVEESVHDPLRYYQANIGGAVALLSAMQRHKVYRLVFSSSAAVYGSPDSIPITEDAPRAALNPYGRTKLVIEHVIDDLVVAAPQFTAISLRYFNPVGAHASGLLGENPRGVPTNLFPYIAQTAAGIRPYLRVYGDDYPTPDGTGVRDFIHVVDLAKGHLAALRYLMANAGDGFGNLAVNLGCGRGYSVLEAVAAFTRASGREISYRIEARRPGDVAESVADPLRATRLFGWRAVHDIDRMCADHWAFQRRAFGI